MSSAKTERLINLTMALLASRRYMTKSEIFRRVSGYSGSQETKERMFERDKDDLRALGIEIEVGGHDPLFEDEMGYRILPENYRLPIADFTQEELTLITAALNFWNESEIEADMNSAIRRFNSIGIHEDGQGEIELPRLALDDSGLITIADALSSRRGVAFNYRKAGSKSSSSRRIHPLGLSAWRGDWYVVGEDLEKGDVRAFKLSRIEGSIDLFGSKDSYEIPEDFQVREYLIMYAGEGFDATLKIRKDHGHALRYRASVTESVDDDWDRITIRFDNEKNALVELRWFIDSIAVESPESLRQSIEESLREGMVRYA